MRKYRALALAMGAALALSACGNDEEVPSPSAAPVEARPAISTERFADAQNSIFESVEEADAEMDSDALSARTVGPFTQIRSAEYQLKEILADSYGLERISSSPVQTVISPAGEYPHSAISIMDAPQGSNLQTIDVFQQNSARDNWALWGVLDILPGATIPALAVSDGSGQPVDAESAEGLVASPKEVLEAYSSLSETGSDSKDLNFLDDRLRQTLRGGKEANIAAVEGAGEVEMLYTPGEEGIVSFATDDGGALVVGQMDFNTKIHVTTEGATIKLGSTIGTLGTGEAGGEIEVSGTLEANYTVLVAFHVPAADSDDDAIQVVGASDPILLSVKNG
ncbi:hypothetical protein VR010_07100 [Actinomycetaceae bacterium L2_0104]